jgi:hypothetical protein
VFAAGVREEEDTAREIVILRPEVQKRFFRGAADFPGESGERSNLSTVFANFDGAAVNSLRQACSSAERSTPGIIKEIVSF